MATVIIHEKDEIIVFEPKDEDLVYEISNPPQEGVSDDDHKVLEPSDTTYITIKFFIREKK